MPGENPGIFFARDILWNRARKRVCIETAQVPEWRLFQPGSGGLIRLKVFTPHSSLAGFANCR
jgi:hypothetical protein